MKKRVSNNTAIVLLYLFFLSINKDSHIFRKYGSRKSIIVMKKAQGLLKKISFQAELQSQLSNFDKYLKKFSL